MKTLLIIACLIGAALSQSVDDSDGETQENQCPYRCMTKEKYVEKCGWLNWGRCSTYRMKVDTCYKPCGTGTGTGTGSESVCTTYPCLIFQDDFNTLDYKVWEHEITAGGGGNWEFQYYTNNRSNSYVKEGVLYLKPTLTADRFGESFLYNGVLKLWGGGPYDTCTGNAFWGCERTGSGGNIINPIQSARLRSSRGMNVKYGKVEVRAKLPLGDWLWPAIWMLPTYTEYGLWPASGEIDIMESRGNRDLYDENGRHAGASSYGSTIHYGPDYFHNGWSKAHKSWVMESGSYADDFHTYGVQWDEDEIVFSFDGEVTLRIAPGEGGFWEYGNFTEEAHGYDSPWKYATKMAPFDKEFFIILNLAVGGFNYFGDNLNNTAYPKPWTEAKQTEFWEARDLWYPTWNPDVRDGEDAALKIDFVKVWKLKP